MSPRTIVRTLAAAVLAIGYASAPAVTPRAGADSPFQYVSPLPGAERVLPETNIIIRPGGKVDPLSITEGARATISVAGARSGPHDGRIAISDDGRTLVFRPDAPFLAGETVTCRVAAGLRTDVWGEISPTEFTFTIAGPERETLRDFRAPPEDQEPLASAGGAAIASAGASGAGVSDSLPADFPPIQSTVAGTPTPGRLFLASIEFRRPGAPSYLMILENDGTPFFYRRLDGSGLDFKLQPDGRLTYFDTSRGGFFALDSTYAVVDSFRCGNGYTTDHHELIVLPDGHALLMAYDPQVVDMSTIIPKGNPSAVVIGLIVQELDREKNVVFQWRSWDHFKITDIVGHLLSGTTVDYVHGNSIDVGPDGHVIISSRHMDEVTKIHRETGEIIWRLGGKNNQFTFVNDPLRFSHQHSARWLRNGNLTLFDNGNFHVPQLSRAVEYEIDEKKMTATLVWQFRHDPDVFGPATGNVQRLPNGNTLVQWGITTPTLSEVTLDGRVVLEQTFAPGIFTYRAFRFDWPPVKSANVALFPSTFTTEGDAPSGGIAPDEGGLVKATIEPVDFDASTVDPETVRLAGVIPSVLQGAALGDANGNGVSDLTVAFDRAALTPLLDATTTWLTVDGSLTTGGRFRGFALVRVSAPRDPPLGIPPDAHQGTLSLRLMSASGEVPVVIVARGGAGDRTLTVHDVQGRLVRRWRLTSGRDARTIWDGRGSDGSAVVSGIYFVRIEDGGAGAGRAMKVLVAR
jgi:hypothetical protein